MLTFHALYSRKTSAKTVNNAKSNPCNSKGKLPLGGRKVAQSSNRAGKQRLFRPSKTARTSPAQEPSAVRAVGIRNAPAGAVWAEEAGPAVLATSGLFLPAPSAELSKTAQIHSKISGCRGIVLPSRRSHSLSRGKIQRITRCCRSFYTHCQFF